LVAARARLERKQVIDDDEEAARNTKRPQDRVSVGVGVGSEVGDGVGIGVGEEVGSDVGAGSGLGTSDGNGVGNGVGTDGGSEVGWWSLLMSFASDFVDFLLTISVASFVCWLVELVIPTKLLTRKEITLGWVLFILMSAIIILVMNPKFVARPCDLRILLLQDKLTLCEL